MNYTAMFLATLSAILFGLPLTLYAIWLAVLPRLRTGIEAAQEAMARVHQPVPSGGGAVPCGCSTPTTEEEWEAILLEQEKAAVEFDRSQDLRTRVIRRLLKEGKLQVPSMGRRPAPWEG